MTRVAPDTIVITGTRFQLERRLIGFLAPNVWLSEYAEREDLFGYNATKRTRLERSRLQHDVEHVYNWLASQGLIQTVPPPVVVRVEEFGPHDDDTPMYPLEAALADLFSLAIAIFGAQGITEAIANQPYIT